MSSLPRFELQRSYHHVLPQDHYLQQIVSPCKDVEGLNYKFHYNLYHKYVSLLDMSADPTVRLSYQHPVSRAEIPLRILSIARTNPRTTQRRCTTARNRQVDLALHAARRRESPRTHRGVQRALAIRRPRIRPHDHRHQQVRTLQSPGPHMHHISALRTPLTIPFPDRKSLAAHSPRSSPTTARASSPSTSTRYRSTPSDPPRRLQTGTEAARITHTTSCAPRRPSLT